MAMEHIDTVIGRLTSDKAFRMKYCQDPDGTLASFLTREEIQAIKTGDGHRLTLMGCGDRLEDLHAALCGPNPPD